MITAVLVAAMLQSAAINSQRDSFISCLEKARQSAKSEKIGGDAFEGYARQSCAAVVDKFREALVAFDAKNKVPRKQALSDAQIQIDDFVTGEAQIYKRDAPKGSTVPPTPASSPNK